MSMSMIVGSFVVELLNQHFLGVASSSLKELKEISPQLAFRLKILNPVLLLLILLLPAYLFAYLAYPKLTTPSIQSRWVSASFIMAVVFIGGIFAFCGNPWNVEYLHSLAQTEQQW